jgi:hypothetical protein|tara:strand:- start:7395 stop:8465 length:1071 start_codon:yes stop_codon:yes gene_type:complete
MSIATTNQYWTSRLHGGDPTSPTGNNNEAWTATGTGAAEGDYWKITTSGYYSLSPTTDDLTILAHVFYPNAADIPPDGTTLIRLRSDSHAVEVQSTGTATGLKIVGATTSTFDALDLTMVEDGTIITTIRLTLNAAGTGTMYVHEIVEDDFGDLRSLSVTGTADTTGRDIRWGSSDGETKWGSVYATHHGVFDPDELAQSAFYQSVLPRLGLAVRNVIRNSKRMSLKSIPDSNIVYGYDISSSMIVRLIPPTVHIIVAGQQSDEFEALGGTSIRAENEVLIFITTKGTDYQESYRFGLRIMGDIFDEVYTNTGLDSSQDSLVGFAAQFDNKLDADEQVCVHQLNLRYMRRERMTIR